MLTVPGGTHESTRWCFLFGSDVCVSAQVSEANSAGHEVAAAPKGPRKDVGAETTVLHFLNGDTQRTLPDQRVVRAARTSAPQTAVGAAQSPDASLWGSRTRGDNGRGPGRLCAEPSRPRHARGSGLRVEVGVTSAPPHALDCESSLRQ